jgi:eukaryotic-like serine/threonine-protein kinase
LEFPIGHVLFQSSGWISHIRVSPQSDRIAFMNHPLLWDDGGSVAVVDLAGNARTLSPEWEGEDGLAWTPDGKEIWFTAALKGNARSLRATDLSGHVRTVLELPAAMTLQDVSSNGRVLITLDTVRLNLDAATLGSSDEVDLSWHDWNIAKDISRDGQWVLFEDASEAAGVNGAVAVRKINGDPPVRLGEGGAGGLSPDEAWAISISENVPQKVVLLPLKAGQPREVDSRPLENISHAGANFLPDGKRIVLNASRPGQASRYYLLDLDREHEPRPLTPEGTTGGAVSSDGKYVIGFAADNSFALYPTAEGGPLRRIPNVDPAFVPGQWSQDDSALYGHHVGELPMRVYRVEIATGKETMVKELHPGVPAGVVNIAPVDVSRDGKHFLYSYNQTLSVLWFISGLH